MFTVGISWNIADFLVLYKKMPANSTPNKNANIVHAIRIKMTFVPSGGVTNKIARRKYYYLFDSEFDSATINIVLFILGSSSLVNGAVGCHEKFLLHKSPLQQQKFNFFSPG